MKFGYDNEGKLVPIEEIKLAETIADLNAQLEALAPESRRASVEKLRALLESTGEALTPEDENVFSLYEEGVLDFRNVEDHLGLRLWRAVLRGSGEGESAA